jgi:hypothetical protein
MSLVVTSVMLVWNAHLANEVSVLTSGEDSLRVRSQIFGGVSERMITSCRSIHTCVEFLW